MGQIFRNQTGKLEGNLNWKKMETQHNNTCGMPLQLHLNGNLYIIFFLEKKKVP